MRILFVCVHNSGRSQIAEAYVNALAKDSGLDVQAESAGTLAGSAISPIASAAMAEVGIDLSSHRPKQLTQAMADRADRIITMGCGVDANACPAGFLAAEDWNLDDPADKPIGVVREIRDEIQRRVEELLESARS